MEQLEQLIGSAKPIESSHLQRDKIFISDIRECIVSENLEKMRWAFDQMRNLSQGFGSYCGDLKRLDALLDDLESELKLLLLTAR